MRYYKQSTILFTTADGLSVVLKDTLPITPKAAGTLKVTTSSETALDEIASRKEIYGERMEAECYRIFDENIEELFESRFDMSKIPTLRVPL
jgi:hypothetical protein